MDVVQSGSYANRLILIKLHKNEHQMVDQRPQNKIMYTEPEKRESAE